MVSAAAMSPPQSDYYWNYLNNQLHPYIIALFTEIWVSPGIPPTIVIGSTCDSLHAYHGIALWYYSRDEVMTALGFSNADVRFVQMTELGFQMNPQIP